MSFAINDTKWHFMSFYGIWHMTLSVITYGNMGIVRIVLISTIDLRYPKSWSKNIFWKKIKNSKIPIFPLYFWVYSLVNVKVQFWEGGWPRIKKFIKRKLLGMKFYKRIHLSQIWNTNFLHFPFFWPPLLLSLIVKQKN